MVATWPHPKEYGAPVWHLHESFGYLERLIDRFPRVCLGSSGDYAQIGTPRWWRRMHEVMRVVCDDAGQPRCRLHGLRMLNPRIFSAFPFASADSTNIGRNIGIDKAWYGSYPPPNKEGRAEVMRRRVESHNSPAAYDFNHEQGED